MDSPIEAPSPQRQWVTPELVQELEAISPGGVHQGVDLSQLSRWQIGGNADCIVRPKSTEQVAELIKWLNVCSLPHMVIGATSNLLFADEGLRIPCIQIGSDMSSLSVQGETVEVQAGAWVPGLARQVMQHGLTGAEHICGIPGTLGGLLCMNGGSQRKGIGSSVVIIESVDPFGAIRHRTSAESGFAYRQSVYQGNGEVITGAVLKFKRGNKRVIRQDMLSILGERGRKFPRKAPNCGSVFKSNPAMYDDVGPPGAVIERLGFKGRRVGGAQVSPLHANFIVNDSTARATDVLTLIRGISHAVHAEYGYHMQSEVQHVSSNGKVSPANEVP